MKPHGHQGGGWKQDEEGRAIHRTSCRWNEGISCAEYGSKRCINRCSYRPGNERIHLDDKKKKNSPDAKLSKDIGYEIASIRDIWGLSATRLSNKTHPRISPQRLADIEEGIGDPITISEFEAIRAALDISADRLLGVE